MEIINNNEPSIRIIRTCEQHIDDIMIIEKLCFTIPWSRNAFIQELKNNQFAIYFSALSDNKVIGYAGMWKILDEGHITNIAVHPGFRKNGIGAKLLEALIDIAKIEKIEKMTLEVRESNISARKLYVKYGFSIGGIRKSYYTDNGEDALIMWKNSYE